MSAPTSVFANTPTASGTTITFTATAVGATSYVFNMYQLTSSSTTLVGSSPVTVTTSSGTASTTFTPAVAGAAYMFTVVAYNGAVAAGIVYSPTLFYALTIVGGPQGVQGNPGAAGPQGPQGPAGAQGLQGLQGVIAINNFVSANSNSLITTTSVAGNVFANPGLTYNGTILSNSAGGITASGDITAYSDRRLKNNIVNISNALGKTLDLQGIYFTKYDDPRTHMGLIAQDVEDVIPEVVTTGDDPEHTKSVAYGNIVALLVEAIKELEKRVAHLEKIDQTQ